MVDYEPTEYDESISQMYEEDMNVDSTPDNPTPSPEQEEAEYINELNRIKDLAHATLRGEFGRGDARRQALDEDYDAVMKVVAEIRTGKGK